MSLIDAIPELEIAEEFIPFSEFENIDINYKKGIYFIFDKNNIILYIGQAVNLKERLRQHFKGNTHTKYHSQDFCYFKFHEIENDFEREMYETYYINKLNPIYNKGKNFNKQINDVEILSESRPNAENDFDFLLSKIKGKKTLEKAKKHYPDLWENYIETIMNSM